MEKRAFVILTCDHKKARELLLNEEVLSRIIMEAFPCKSIVIAKKKGLSNVSFFVGILFEQKEGEKTFFNKKKMETLFRDFNNLTIKFRKGFAPICCFFMDIKSFSVYGQLSREEILRIATNSRQHKKFVSSPKESESYIKKKITKNQKKERPFSFSHKERPFSFSYVLKWIIACQFFYSILNLQIPPLVLLLREYLISFVDTSLIPAIVRLDLKIRNTELEKISKSFLENFDPNPFESTQPFSIDWFSHEPGLLALLSTLGKFVLSIINSVFS